MRLRQLLLPLSLSCSCWAASAGSNWLTITGDPQDAGSDTVQVDPLTHGRDGTLQIRISRAQQRTSWDGVPYRSYTAEVAFDCTANRARYHSIRFYGMPLWRGTSHATVDYSTGPPRMMEFRDMEPNPTARLVAAACNSVPRRAAPAR